jgi:transcriptional regulator with XRE-family HTH domain
MTTTGKRRGPDARADLEDLESRFRVRWVAARKAAGMTQDDVAAALGVTQQIVGRFEKDKNPRRLFVNEMVRWAAAIGRRWDDVLGVEEWLFWGDEVVPRLKDLRAQLAEQQREFDERRSVAEALEVEATTAIARMRRTERAANEAWARVGASERHVQMIRAKIDAMTKRDRKVK